LYNRINDAELELLIESFHCIHCLHLRGQEMAINWYKHSKANTKWEKSKYDWRCTLIKCHW
jgi:hypothetical protein